MNTNKKYYKITNKQENHHGLQYHTGLNIDILPFNPSGDCKAGGIYFSDIKNILAFLDYGYYIREVTLPEGEEIYQNPSSNGEAIKYKAHQVILGKRREINLDVIKELVNEGADIHIENESCLRWAAEYGHLDIVKYCIEECGCYIHILNYYCLRYAAYNGHLDIVKYIINKGFDIKNNEDKNYILSVVKNWSDNNCYNEIIKYIYELESK